MQVKIQFQHQLEKTEMLNQINNLGNKSVVVFWYVGTNGLKVDCVKYYQKIFQSVTNLNPKTKIMLYDLTGWKGLFDTNSSVYHFNDQMDKVNYLTNGRMITMKSSDFFHWLLNVTNNKTRNFIENSFCNEELYNPSNTYQNTNIRFSDIKEFSKLSESVIYSKDTGKSYSCLQHIEFYYLIEKLVRNGFEEIYFALPNDEYKYYDITDYPFELNLENFLSASFNTKKQLKITIASFKFGKHTYQRPYNMGKELVSELKSDMLL